MGKTPLQRQEPAMQDEVKGFLEAYGDAFSRGPEAIAEFYSEPCITARAGMVRVNEARNDIEQVFAEVERNYRARGCTHGSIGALDILPVGTNSAFATVHWAYKGAGDETLWESTFSYNLYRRDGAWKILVQIMHDA